VFVVHRDRRAVRMHLESYACRITAARERESGVRRVKSGEKGPIESKGASTRQDKFARAFLPHCRHRVYSVLYYSCHAVMVSNDCDANAVHEIQSDDSCPEGCDETWSTWPSVSRWCLLCMYVL
jgi:hypothetical protein